MLSKDILLRVSKKFDGQNLAHTAYMQITTLLKFLKFLFFKKKKKLSSTATYKSLVTKPHCIFLHRALGALPGCTSFRKTRVEGNGAGGSD